MEEQTVDTPPTETNGDHQAVGSLLNLLLIKWSDQQLKSFDTERVGDLFKPPVKQFVPEKKKQIHLKSGMKTTLPVPSVSLCHSQSVLYVL